MQCTVQFLFDFLLNAKLTRILKKRTKKNCTIQISTKQGLTVFHVHTRDKVLTNV